MTGLVPRTCVSFILVTSSIAPALPASAQVGAPPSAPATTDTGYVDYGEPLLSLPVGIGLRMLVYNRVDGLALPWGPMVSLANDRVRIDPTITYRSHIGKLDPFVVATLRGPSAIRLELAGGRATFTNDAWIRSDLVNSLAALFVGSDARNYFRADRGWVMLSRDLSYTGLVLTPAIGARFENDWSTGVPVRHTNAPWSMFAKTDTLRMRRVNPAITKGHINSGVGRLVATYEREEVKGTFDGLVEHAFRGPLRSRERPGVLEESLNGSFSQLTLHAVVGFPTFGTQRFDFRGHSVFTSGLAPAQRFGYLGGAGTLATVDLLAIGGDKLFFAEGTYSVPIDRIAVPLAGSPIVSVRYAAGSAGIGGLPDFIQNIGVALGVKLIKFEYDIDPSYKSTSFTHKHAFSVSLDLPL